MNNISLIGLLEIKIKEKNVNKIANNIFPRWKWHHNYQLNQKGRIWIAWDPSVFNIQVEAMSE